MHTDISCLSHCRCPHFPQDCYKKLYDGGMQGKVQYAYSKFEFSHEKYWIIDGTTVHLSTGTYGKLLLLVY